jgi:hypothetical protein
MKTQSYYKLPTKVEGYALAVYQSKVILIGGNLPSSQNQGRAMGDPKYPITVLDDDCGLEERLKSALDRVPQESRCIYEIGKNACAVGEGDLLIVIGGDGSYISPPASWLSISSHSPASEYVRVFDGQNWSYGVIGITYREGSRDYSIDITSMQKNLLVYQNHIYMTACDHNYLSNFFYRISLEYFRNQFDPKARLIWNLLEDVPDGAHCTSLSVLGNQLVTVGVVDGGFRMYAYSASSSKWFGVHVHEFQSSAVKSVSSIIGIVGLQSSSSPYSDQVEALLVGMDADHQLTKIYKLITKCKQIFISVLCFASGVLVLFLVHHYCLIFLVSQELCMSRILYIVLQLQCHVHNNHDYIIYSCHMYMNFVQL